MTLTLAYKKYLDHYALRIATPNRIDLQPANTVHDLWGQARGLGDAQHGRAPLTFNEFCEAQMAAIKGSEGP